MQQMVGRKPKAGRCEGADKAEFLQVFSFAYGVAPSSPKLKWKIPFPKVLKLLNTVDGIGRVALRNRNTIRRDRIQPGGAGALIYAVESRRGTLNPLVRHEGDIFHRLNVRGPVKDHVEKPFRDLIGWIWEQKQKPRGEFPKVLKTSAGMVAQKRGGSNAYYSERARPATEEENKDLIRAAAARRVYLPEGRVTVVNICLAFGYKRDDFNNWRRRLPRDYREFLDAALAPAIRRPPA